MARTIQQILFPAPMRPSLKRVAAYARVSSGTDAMLHSLSAQVSYYNTLIQNHTGWLYCGAYTDEASTGTKDSRKGFQSLLSECRAGNIDMIITKSISRFARNTVTLLETVRELKALGIDVYFEEQNIHTMSADGELMMTILASYAQEESRSASENQKWRIQRNFQEGIPWNGFVLGYCIRNGKYEIVPEDAATVSRIYKEYLSGSGCSLIAKGLNEDNIPSPRGGRWHPSAIVKILHNYSYTGNLLLQKTFCEDHISKRSKVNDGQLPQYMIEDAHEAIIDRQTFEKVQKELERRAEKYYNCRHEPRTYPFSGLLVCEHCGKHYRRKTTATQIVWVCGTYNTLGKSHCASKQIPETTLELHTNLATDDLSKIQKIVVADHNTLYYHMKDGRTVTRQWKDRSRRESWTAEKREAARQRATERRASTWQKQ